jgi:peptidoglycan/LPS O-acetylase OafA/YrhL
MKRDIMEQASVPQAANSRHLKHVEGMRALAALVVYVNHAYAQTWLPDRNRFPTGALSVFTYSLVAGHLAVTVFIVISGFCLTLPVIAHGDRIRGGAREFFKRRSRRILPAYYGAVALCLCLIYTIIGEPTGTLWDVPITVTWPGTTRIAIISHLLLLQDLFAGAKINYVFWSIAVEWHIYFLFPLLVWSWRRFGPRWTVPLAIVAGYGLMFGFEAARVARANPHYVGMFTLGMLAAYVSQSSREDYVRLRQKVPWAWICAICFALVCGLTAFWGWEIAVHRFPMLDLPVGVMAASLLVLSSRSTSLWSRALSWKPIVVMGTFSYSVYLVHAPLLQILWQYVVRPAHMADQATFAFLMTIGLALVLGAAYLFFRVFELPFMRAATARRREVAPVPASL